MNFPKSRQFRVRVEDGKSVDLIHDVEAHLVELGVTKAVVGIDSGEASILVPLYSRGCSPENPFLGLIQPILHKLNKTFFLVSHPTKS